VAISDLILWCDRAEDDSGESFRSRREASSPEPADSSSRARLTIPPERERALLDQIRAGDVHAFEEVYLALYSPLREFAYALTRDDGSAHDIVQDVLFVFWRDRVRVAPGDRFIPYLYKAVRNQGAKHWRHARIVRRLFAESSTTAKPEIPIPGMSTPSAGAPESAEQAELHTALVAAVEHLPTKQREIVTLYLSAELNAPEIGDVLGISPEAVLMGLSRARKTLRVALEKFRR